MSDQFFSHTLSICAIDPLVFNEIGVLRYLEGNYEEAAEAFGKALHLCKTQLMKQLTVSETAEASLFNLGHCYRKMRRFDQALEMYKRAQSLCPNKASTYTALALTYHLMSDFDSAINLYHKVPLPASPPPPSISLQVRGVLTNQPSGNQYTTADKTHSSQLLLT